MKNKNKKQQRETKAIALSQILILVIATIAFSWMIGSEVETVSAADGSSCRACVGNSVYSGVEKEGSCDITNGVLLSTCTSTQTCSGGVCLDNEDTTTSEEKDKLTFGEVVGYGLGALGSIDEIKDVGKSAIEGIEKITEKSVSDKVGEVATEAVQQATQGTTTSSAEGIHVYDNPNKPFGEYFKLGRGTGVSQIISNAFYGAIVATIIIYFANKYASERNAGGITTFSLVGLGIGIGASIVWSTVAQISNMVASIAGASLMAGPPGWIAAAVVVFVTGVYMLVGGYQLYSKETFTYRVSMWQPPTGGSECEKCNLLKFGTGENKVNGCTEYICHSYGAACNWTNDETVYETCFEDNPNDISAPVIAPAKEIYGENVFPNNQYDYRTSAAGARIIYTGENGGTNQCVPSFTPLKLALTTEENAHCKISLESNNATATEAFSAMQDMAEGNAYTKNHTLQLPSSVSANQDSLTAAGYVLNNGGVYRFYVRCEDTHGNVNTVDYAMQFCVQIGPDRSPPVITGTNPAQNSYIPYNTSKIEDFQVYTNEPADCKWDTKEVNYQYMNYNFTQCSQRVDDYLVGLEYGCQVNLTGFKNGVENKYYVACKDHPELNESKRNTGRPYEIILKGTDRLMIQTVRINGKTNGTIIRGSEETAKITMEVMTSNGAEEGKARCLYSINTNDESSYSLFNNDGSIEFLSTNTEEFYMPQGFYKAFIKCYDIAENSATTMINFTVEVDTSSPTVVRVYKDEDSNSLKIITDEVGGCVYSTTSCIYALDEGTEMDTNDGKEHYVEWNPDIDLYVKCTDEYENGPEEGVCSIIVRPFDVAQVI